MKTKPEKIYKGFTLHRGRSWQDWKVTLPAEPPRTRWGTLDEVKDDVDAFLAGSIPPHKRPSWA